MKKPYGFTVHDIARLAGVSAMTISRAINNPEKVSPDTLARVLEVIKTTGFVPNGMARGLRSSHAKLVAALLPSLKSAVFQETVQSLSHRLQQLGYQLMIGQSGYDASQESALLDALIQRRPDGIISIGRIRTAEGRQRLVSSGIPVVEAWDLPSAPLDMLVGFSHEQIGKEVAEFFLAKGYLDVGVISASDDRARRREHEFKTTMETRLGAKVHVVLGPAPSTLLGGRTGLQELLKSRPRLRAVFCSSDSIAMGALLEASVLGLKVPEDLAVVGLGDQEFAANLNPPLTTVRIDGTRIGRIAADLIVGRTEGKPSHGNVVDVGFALIERQST